MEAASLATAGVGSGSSFLPTSGRISYARYAAARAGARRVHDVGAPTSPPPRAVTTAAAFHPLASPPLRPLVSPPLRPLASLAALASADTVASARTAETASGASTAAAAAEEPAALPHLSAHSAAAAAAAALTAVSCADAAAAHRELSRQIARNREL